MNGIPRNAVKCEWSRCSKEVKEYIKTTCEEIGPGYRELCKDHASDTMRDVNANFCCNIISHGIV